MNVVVIGAHPDDAEFFAGGCCLKWVARGDRVTAVSMTNGDAGHHEIAPADLAARRLAEVRRSAELAGMRSHVFDYPDGELMPSLEARKAVVRLIRECEAGLVLTHRPWDYHPDHRYTSQLVQDAAFMVTVPHFCPETPALMANPVFAYLMDAFTRPCPFQPDVAVAVDGVMDRKWELIDAMASQVYEWLPWLGGRLATVPLGAGGRKKWLREEWDPFFLAPAAAHREALAHWYGEEEAAAVRYAELFEICEYGRQAGPEELAQLFPVA